MATQRFLITHGPTHGLSSAITSVGKTLDGITKKLKKKSGEFALEFQDEVIDLLMRIKDETPVDTGEAQAGWDLDRTKTDKRLSYVISNSVSHIGLLEFGKPDGRPHSLLQPKGMARTNLLIFEFRMKKLAEGFKSDAGI